MTAPVTLITVHHEGAGAPTTAANCARFAEGGYTYGLGTDGWQMFRTVWSSWGTLNFNGTSLDVCLSGNRMDYPVSDSDLDVLRSAVADARKQGFVTDFPQVRAHCNSPGSATVCPGNHTLSRWIDVEAACMATAPPTPTPQPPEDDVTDLASAENHDKRPMVFQVGGDRRLYFKIWSPGGDWGSWRDLTGGFKDFVTVTAFSRSSDQRVEVWVTMLDGKTFSRVQTADFASWEPWIDQTR